MNNKVKSFTLSEMLVVLVITAIVVGLAFSILTLVRKQIRILQTNAEETTKRELLESKFIIDFNKYSEISINDENLIKFKNELDSTFYTIKDNFIITNNDTIAKKMNKIDFYYKNKIITIGRIDALKIVLEPKKGVYRAIFVYRKNDATELNEINLDGFQIRQ